MLCLFSIPIYILPDINLGVSEEKIGMWEVGDEVSEEDQGRVSEVDMGGIEVSLKGSSTFVDMCKK